MPHSIGVFACTTTAPRLGLTLLTLRRICGTCASRRSSMPLRLASQFITSDGVRVQCTGSALWMRHGPRTALARGTPSGSQTRISASLALTSPRFCIAVRVHCRAVRLSSSNLSSARTRNAGLTITRRTPEAHITTPLQHGRQGVPGGAYRRAATAAPRSCGRGSSRYVPPGSSPKRR